jgi:two-component system, chemotaxis family, chemotaxis protein CheY
MAFNVLVVDDSEVMRAMVLKTLRLSGVPLGEVHQAGNGLEGLQLLDTNWIDLALVDINMPVMRGEEMIDRIRANPATADLPVVVVSTERSEARIAELREKGVEFVHKPFTPEALRATVLRITGIDDDDFTGDVALPGGGYDF